MSVSLTNTPDVVYGETHPDPNKISILLNQIVAAINAGDTLSEATDASLQAQVDAISGGLTLAGTWSPAGGAFPSGSTAGEYYIATDDGVIDGVNFFCGDWLIALVSSASTTTYAANWLQSDAQRKLSTNPIVILVSGQSNSELREALAWTPPANFKGMWSYYGSGLTDSAATTTIGTFGAPDPTNMSFGLGIGEQYAIENPTRDVYVISVGKGGENIAQWISGASDPDMWTAIQNNVPAALTEISTAVGFTVSAIDAMFWWQGENDASTNNVNYVSNFNTLHTQLRGETWFEYDTPIQISNISPHGSTVREEYRKYLIATVAADPVTRAYFDAGQYPISDWDSDPGVNYVHMADGPAYRRAGNAAASQMARGGQIWPAGFTYSEYLDTYALGQGAIPVSFWDWLLRKDTNGSTTLTVQNDDAGASASAQVMLQTDSFAMDLTQFESGAAQVKSTGSGTFTIDNASGAIQFKIADTVVFSVNSAGALELGGVGGWNGTMEDVADVDVANPICRTFRGTGGTLPGAGFWFIQETGRTAGVGSQFAIKEDVAANTPTAAVRHRDAAGGWSAWATL